MYSFKRVLLFFYCDYNLVTMFGDIIIFGYGDKLLLVYKEL